MKAFLLAAGKGTRLDPITRRTPKCLMAFGGVPLLGIWLRKLRDCGVESVLVNTHHLPEPVRDYVARHPLPGLSVRLCHETALLGSAGTVAANRDFVGKERTFLIAYADNLTDMDLEQFCRYHREKGSPFTVGMFEASHPEECGILTCAEDGRVAAFEEKPKQPRSRWANAGVYAAGPVLLDAIPAKVPCDFGYDVLPRLVGRMYGYPIPGFFCDIGTKERLRWARRQWAALAKCTD
jgi:mannose-1-phosphate guanylyltransferase